MRSDHSPRRSSGIRFLAVFLAFIAASAAVLFIVDEAEEDDAYFFIPYITYDDVTYHIVQENTMSKKGEVEVGSVYMDGTPRPAVDTGITSVTIPGSFKFLGITYTVTGIGTSAFEGCESLYRVDFRSTGIETISDRAFYGCSSLQEIALRGGVTSIGASAFQNCTSLKSVTGTSNLQTIGESAFQGCSSLETFTDSGRLTQIGSHAFDGCSSLTDIGGLNRLVRINEYAFAGCPNLSVLGISDRLSQIMQGAFQDCTSLTFEVKREYFGTHSKYVYMADGALPLTADVMFVSAMPLYDLRMTDRDGNTLETVVGHNEAYYVWVDKGATTTEYTVTYRWLNGTVTTESHSEGDVVVLPDTGSMPGYILSWTSDDVSISDGSFIMPASDITVTLSWEAVDVPEIEKGDQEAPATGEGFTINYYSEYVEAWDGYQVSSDEGSGTNRMAVKPGGSFYIRLKETDTLNASPWTMVDVPARPVTPSNPVLTASETTVVCDGNLQLSINGRSWSGELYGLLPGTTYTVQVRLAATETSFHGTTVFVSVATVPEFVKGDQEAPAVGEGYIIDYISETMTALEGYEVGAGDAQAPIVPGYHGYVRLAATDTLNASPWTRIDIAPRPSVPTLTVDGARVHTDSGLEYSLDMEDWTICPDGILRLEDGEYWFRQRAVAGESFHGEELLIHIRGIAHEGLRATVDGIVYQTESENRAFIIGYEGTPGPLRTEVEIDGYVCTVNCIEDYAFANCTTLRTVTVPGSYTYVGTGAFMGCTGLESAILGEGILNVSDSMFLGCTSLETVSLPDGLWSVLPYAFRGCTSLKTIEMPDGADIWGGAFMGCSSLETVILPDGIEGIDEGTFSGCTSLRAIELPDTLIYIGEGSFRDCGSLEAVSLPDGIGSVFPETFAGCASLRSVTMPDGLTNVFDSAFRGCTSLENIIIPACVEAIGKGAFAGCSSLASVSLPEGLDVIWDEAFAGCTSLLSVTIPSTVTYIGDGAFDGCSALESVDLGEGAPHPGSRAFRGCTSLTSVEIPEGVTSVDSRLFSGCSSLESVSIPSTVETIFDEAFAGCASLGAIVIPEGVRSIGDGAFRGCSSLTEVRFLSQDDGISFGDCSFDTGTVTLVYAEGWDPVPEITGGGVSEGTEILNPGEAGASIGQGYIIDYVNELVIAADGYEVSYGKSDSGAPMLTLEPGVTVCVRPVSATDGSSDWAEMEVPQRPDVPSLPVEGLTVETDGTLEYRVPGGEWVRCPDGGLELEPGDYEFRIAAVYGKAFSSEAIALTLEADAHSDGLRITITDIEARPPGYAGFSFYVVMTNVGGSDITVTSCSVPSGIDWASADGFSGFVLIANGGVRSFPVEVSPGLPTGSYDLELTIDYIREGVPGTAFATASFVIAEGEPEAHVDGSGGGGVDTAVLVAVAAVILVIAVSAVLVIRRRGP